MADVRNVTLGNPFITVNPDGTGDAHFSWTPPAPLPQDLITARVHFTLPDAGSSPEGQAALLVAIKDLGRRYILDHESGLRPVASLPAAIAAYNGQVVSLDLEAMGT